MNDLLLFAYQERQKELRGKDPLNKLDRFARTFLSLQEAADTWHENCIELISHENWLVDKPLAYLRVDLTSRGNLYLEWYPTEFPIEDYFGDWKHWSDFRPIMEQPKNRILFIKGFARFLGCVQEDSHKWLCRAAEDLIKTVVRFISSFIEVNLVTNLYIDQPKDFKIRDFSAHVSVQNVAERNQRIEEEKKEAWLKDTFAKLDCEPEELLRTFVECGEKYAPTGRFFKISAEKTKRLVERLKKEYPDIYYKVYEPPYKEPPRNATVINIKRK